MIRRREFITLLGGAAAAAWPLADHAQERDRVQRLASSVCVKVTSRHSTDMRALH